MKRRFLGLGLLAGVLFAGPLKAAQTKLSSLPVSAQDLLTHKLIPLSDDKKLGTIVVFLSSRCPCSTSHETTLKELATQFPSFRFLGVHSNQDEPPTEAKAHFAKANLSFPVLQDEKATIANQLGAFKTPHVFLFDKRGDLIFSGGVDNSHLAKNVTKPYLVAALKAAADGRKPDPAQVRTLGCVIKR